MEAELGSLPSIRRNLLLNTHLPLLNIMRDHSLQALIDFSAGCNFSVILVACVLLLIRRKRTRLHHLSSLFFIYLAGINFVLFFQFYIHNFFGSQLVVATNLLQATVIPFGVCLLRELTHPGRVGRRMLLFNMLSCWAMLLVYWVLKSEIIYYLFIFALLIYGIVGLSCAVFAAHRYDLKLKDWSSYTEGVDLRWLGKTVWAFLGIFAVWIIASFLDQEWVVVPYNFSICAFFAVIAYCLSRQQVVDFSKENPFDGADGQDAALADGPEKAPVAEEADEEVVPFKQALQERMVQVFETERVFLDKKLTIVRLAEIVGTNRTYLSNFINAELQSSFSDYVNGYRVSFAKTLLVENNAPLDVIAEMSGFNSVSSFRRMFSAVEGCTPGQYRRKACNEKADGDIQPLDVK